MPYQNIYINNACIIKTNCIFHILLNSARLYLVVGPYSKNITISPENPAVIFWGWEKAAISLVSNSNIYLKH